MTFVRKHRWLLLLILCSILFSLPLLQRLSLGGIQDWDQHMALSESSRQIILTYHQFPLWNPYRCGGMTDIGQPQNRFLWPFFPIILLLGSPIGHKIVFVFHIMLAAIGMFLLARHWKISTVASFYAAIVFAYSGLFTVSFAVGPTNFVNLAWVPWLILCIHIFVEKKNFSGAFPFIVATAIIMTWMFFGGWNYIALVAILVGTLVIVGAVEHKRWHPIYFGMLALCFFVGLAAIKLFPSIETIYRYPRFVATVPHDGYSLPSLLFSLLSRNQTFESWQSLIEKGAPMSFGIDENSMYVGMYSLVLLFVGLLDKNRSKRLLMPLLVFLWIILGVNVTPSLYSWLHTLPIFSMMMVAQRYKYFFMAFFALIAGIGFDAGSKLISKHLNAQILLFIQMAALAFIFTDLYKVNTSIFATAFRTIPTKIPKSSVFRQLASTSFAGQTNRAITYAAGVQEYPTIHADYGSINCYESLPLPASPVQSYKDPTYKGEVYLLKTHDSVDYTWSPNIITLSLQKVLKQDDTLVVNQNYDPNWWIIRNNVKIERAMNEHGILAAPVSPSDTNVTFLYLPLTFVFGAIVTLLSCVVLGKTFFALSKKRP